MFLAMTSSWLTQPVLLCRGRARFAPHLAAAIGDVSFVRCRIQLSKHGLHSASQRGIGRLWQMGQGGGFFTFSPPQSAPSPCTV
jgi:hypothetical protein